jgi:hypothetical protein
MSQIFIQNPLGTTEITLIEIRRRFKTKKQLQEFFLTFGT